MANHVYRATLLARDEPNDLALLTAEHEWHDIATFRDGADLRPGDAVVAAGFPLQGVVSSGLSVTTGSVTALTGLQGRFTRGADQLAPLQPGSSGGPILDLNGHVIGIAAYELTMPRATLLTGMVPQNANFAVKSAIARNFLGNAWHRLRAWRGGTRTQRRRCRRARAKIFCPCRLPQVELRGAPRSRSRPPWYVSNDGGANDRTKFIPVLPLS